jgi:protein TonB
MEIKKTAKADLTRKSSLFFSISLLITMTIIITAFEWRDYSHKEVDLLVTAGSIFDEPNVPLTEIPPPEPPKVPQPIIVVVPNEDKVEVSIPLIDIDATEIGKIPEIILLPKEPKEEVIDEPYVIVEEPASPKGGNNAFYEYVARKMQGKYPAQARRMGIEGKVFVEFVINRDGSLVDVRVVKGIGAGCDELAEKVIKEAPAWNPGKQRGKPVRQRMVIPITFKLG